MPSSISNSSDLSSSSRIPTGNWARTWVLALVIAASVVVAWELNVRIRGVGATSVSDNAELWVRERQRASLLGDDAIILVGASRMQMGIDMQVLDELSVGSPVQLAISASPFMPVLENLANDESITGTVIVSFTMIDVSLQTRGFRSEEWVAQYENVKAGHTNVFYQPVENFLKNAIDALLISLANNLRPQQLLSGPQSSGYVRTLSDRSQQADYSKTDRELAYRRRIELVEDNTEIALQDIPDIDERVRYLESLVRQIRGRSGDVVFVRLPSSKRIRHIEDTRYPRSLYWDRFAQHTAARTIHYADHPALSEFDFPDGVHIDVRDQAEFTREIAPLLLARPEN